MALIPAPVIVFDPTAPPPVVMSTAPPVSVAVPLPVPIHIPPPPITNVAHAKAALLACHPVSPSVTAVLTEAVAGLGADEQQNQPLNGSLPTNSQFQKFCIKEKPEPTSIGASELADQEDGEINEEENDVGFFGNCVKKNIFFSNIAI